VQKEVRAPRAFIFSGAVAATTTGWKKRFEANPEVMKGVSTTYRPERFEPARPTAASAACVYYLSVPLSLASWVFVMHDGVGTLEMELVHLR
jgi:hypothetical protein